MRCSIRRLLDVVAMMKMFSNFSFRLFLHFSSLEFVSVKLAKQWKTKRNNVKCLTTRIKNVWCCRCVRRLLVDSTHICREFSILKSRQKKCDYCVNDENHDCVLDFVLNHFRDVVRAATNRFATHSSSRAHVLILRVVFFQWERAIATTDVFFSSKARLTIQRTALIIATIVFAIVAIVATSSSFFVVFVFFFAFRQSFFFFNFCWAFFWALFSINKQFFESRNQINAK